MTQNKKHKSTNRFAPKKQEHSKFGRIFTESSPALSCVFLWPVCLSEIREWDQYWELVGVWISFNVPKKTQLKNKTNVFSFSVGFDHSSYINVTCSKHWYFTNIRDTYKKKESKLQRPPFKVRFLNFDFDFANFLLSLQGGTIKLF